MQSNTARKLELREEQATPRAPARVIPLRPSVWERVSAWARSTLTTEQVAEATLAIVTVILWGLLFFSLYRGLQNYTVF